MYMQINYVMSSPSFLAPVIGNSQWQMYQHWGVLKLKLVMWRAAVMKKAKTLIKQYEGEADCVSVLVQSTSTFFAE